MAKPPTTRVELKDLGYEDGMFIQVRKSLPWGIAKKYATTDTTRGQEYAEEALKRLVTEWNLTPDGLGMDAADMKDIGLEFPLTEILPLPKHDPRSIDVVGNDVIFLVLRKFGESGAPSDEVQAFSETSSEMP